MAAKNQKNKKQISSEERRRKRQRTTLQIAFAVFSIILILSMVLALVSKF
jgi:predicted nucleic acid-binding Zn ribbon protein